MAARFHRKVTTLVPLLASKVFSRTLTALFILGFEMISTGCNPLASDPKTQVGFNPGVGTSGAQFSKTYIFNSSTSSRYSFDSNQIDFTANSCELISTSQIDNAANTSTIANPPTGFGAGTLSGLSWDSANQYLKLGSAGGCDGTQSNCNSDAELNASWAPQWSNLVAYWKFDEASTATAIVDSSGHGNVGTIQGGVTLGGTGRLNTDAAFDGSSGYIDLGGIAPTVGSISFWMKTPTSAGNWPIFFSGADAFDSGVWNWGIIYYNGSLRVGSVNVYLPMNEWMNVIMVRNDGGSEEAYINGIQYSGDTSNGGALGGDGVLRIGEAGGVFFPGQLDDVAIWSTSLSSTEAQLIYSHQVQKYSGTITSRVMDSFSSNTSWTNFSWMTTLPFFKALPGGIANPSPSSTPFAQNESTTDYPLLDSSHLMDNLVGLWHLDEASTATSVVDSSGYGNVGVPTSVSFGEPGKLGSSASFAGNGYIEVPDSASLDPASGISIQLWLKTTSNNEFVLHKYIENGNTYPGYGIAIFGGTLNCFMGGTGGSWLGGSKWVIDGVYHHVVCTNVNGVTSIYIDGQLDVSGARTPSVSNDPLYIGAGPGGTGAFSGSLDEVAIWSRALSTAEVLELYRRGVNRVKYQVQTCLTSAACTSSPNWQGPDGTNQTYYSELDNTSSYDKVNNVPTGSVNASLPSMTFTNFASPTPSANRFFQYRAILETDDTSYSPEVKSVSVGPGPYPDQPISTISTVSGLNFKTLSSFSETLGTNVCPAGVLYTISKDNLTWYYWTVADFT
jgi:hypothetical protein